MCAFIFASWLVIVSVSTIYFASELIYQILLESKTMIFSPLPSMDVT